ncbi:hypothetical protein ACZ11_04480 [Lysinibacillus xylanilyticus]|uniref:Uncharacterized protein n=1 Tax=Lysinibacillus xylanilyticus TaxID=582475 RepID=A0A0K9FAP2_9BACI|nr:hypothetical protein [Lysinibacillus xylanilyticus]KMY31495.1 hypothetical protein ACZ11_04480 [Lysinibacillus xylanilyticus]
MDFKDKIALYKFKKKYENFPGIKSFRMASNEELTKDETYVIDAIRKIDSKCDDRIPIDSKRSNMIDWVKEKILPYLNYSSEFIIGGNGGLAVFFENIEMFLQHYFKVSPSLDIMILNRDLKKWIVIFEEEYFLEFFIKDI